jgi:hypothetical protein
MADSLHLRRAELQLRHVVLPKADRTDVVRAGSFGKHDVPAAWARKRSLAAHAVRLTTWPFSSGRHGRGQA